MARQENEKPENPMFAIAIMLVGLLVLGFLIWMVASHRIVYGSLRPALFFGQLWTLLPWDYGILQWNRLVTSATLFAPAPVNVSFGAWATFVSAALRPAMALMMLAYLIGFALKGRRSFSRRFTAEALMAQQLQYFSGIAPVVTIRKDIAKDKNPLWRRQVTPQEVFQNYRVPKGAQATLAEPGSPMLRGGKFDREVARAYFTAITRTDAGGRMVSSMLGRQLVNLLYDTADAQNICFADRMSAHGKVLVALWSAVAFGGAAGRDAFAKYRDKLNMSAYGSKDGMANLTLAQPLYDQYRNHPKLRRLFNVHHWEHTALFVLLGLAQKKGRFTTAEVLWLRPMDRVMYFSLNSRGSFTPHTEAAATYSQVAFEAACARQGRLPVMWSEKEEGKLQHIIFIDPAIDGLELEWQRWEESVDDESDDWWLRKDLWKRSDATIAAAMKQVGASVPVTAMPGVSGGGGSTAFDDEASERARRDAEQGGRDMDQLFKDFT